MLINLNLFNMEVSKKNFSLKFSSYTLVFVGVVIMLIQTYAYFMQGEDLMTGYNKFLIQHSAFWMHTGALFSIIGCFIWVYPKID